MLSRTPTPSTDSRTEREFSGMENAMAHNAFADSNV
jgi:hypothetical protein